MSTGDSLANITGQDGTYSIQTHYQGSPGPTGHFQIMGLAFDDGGSTWEVAKEGTGKGFPVRLDAADTVGGYIKALWSGISTDFAGAGGQTAMAVDVVSSAGLTINAIVDSMIIGITQDNKALAQVGVYGTGGTAVGITGSVYNLGTTTVDSTLGLPVFGTGGTAMNVNGYIGITTEYAYKQAFVYGIPGATAVGVTGQVKTDPTSLIGISGGITIANSIQLTVKAADGLTAGGVSGGLLVAGFQGISLEAHGLSSGVRVIALSTGSTSEYVYVGGGTSTGLTHHGFPLREMDDVFIEIDNLNKVCVMADNADAKIRYIGS